MGTWLLRGSSHAWIYQARKPLMRLPRPYIPRAVRREVARRQVDRLYPNNSIPANESLENLLFVLFPTRAAHLDHDPPLGFRKKIKNREGRIVGFDPDANDPEFLRYVEAEAHRIKTFVRGDGAQYPDRVRIKKIRRIEKPKLKRKYRWPKRKLRWRPKDDYARRSKEVKSRSV